MIFKVILNSLKADIKFIIRDPMLLLASVAPLFLVVFLRLLFPLLADFIFEKTNFELSKYYSIVAITMVSVVPMLFGMVYAFILLDENDMHILQVISVTPAGKRNFLYMRMIVPTVISFIFILFTTILTDPVPSEGWLRTLYVSLLLAIQVPFIFLFIGSLASNKVEGLAFSKFYGIFLVAVPLGLLLHHPWNYFTFFSPLYWIGWAWISIEPMDSILYGGISLVITLLSVLLLFKNFLRKHAG